MVQNLRRRGTGRRLGWEVCDLVVGKDKRLGVAEWRSRCFGADGTVTLYAQCCEGRAGCNVRCSSLRGTNGLRGLLQIACV